MNHLHALKQHAHTWRHATVDDPHYAQQHTRQARADFLHTVRQAIDDGIPKTHIAQAAGISRTWLYRLLGQ